MSRASPSAPTVIPEPSRWTSMFLPLTPTPVLRLGPTWTPMGPALTSDLRRQASAQAPNPGPPTRASASADRNLKSRLRGPHLFSLCNKQFYIQRHGRNKQTSLILSLKPANGSRSQYHLLLLPSSFSSCSPPTFSLLPSYSPLPTFFLLPSSPFHNVTSDHVVP